MYRVADTYQLDTRVLAVAVEDGHEWAAYVGPVPFRDHHDKADVEDVRLHGTKLPKAVAKVLFPGLAKMRRWAD